MSELVARARVDGEPVSRRGPAMTPTMYHERKRAEGVDVSAPLIERARTAAERIGRELTRLCDVPAGAAVRAHAAYDMAEGAMVYLDVDDAERLAALLEQGCS